MTLRQLIDKASNIGATIGLDAEFRAWYVGSKPVEPLDVFKTHGLAAGWDKASQKPIAEIRIKS